MGKAGKRKEGIEGRGSRLLGQSKTRMPTKFAWSTGFTSHVSAMACAPPTK